MPVLFVGHGSPMNGIEENTFSKTWKNLGKTLPRPTAVLVVSAHWFTHGTFVTAMENPPTIHDFGGFPQEFFDVQYPAKGSPVLTQDIAKLLAFVKVGLDRNWGLDHGAWTVLKQMYPNAEIPVLQLSIDYRQNAQYHYNLAKQLVALHNKGVLIIGSGNMIHNLRMISWENRHSSNFGFDWSIEINQIFKRKIETKNHQDLMNYQNLGHAATLAIPTPDYYFPLIYSLALQDAKGRNFIFQ